MRKSDVGIKFMTIFIDVFVDDVKSGKVDDVVENVDDRREERRGGAAGNQDTN